MSLNISNTANHSTVPPLDADTYTGVCIGVVDLGTQYNEYYKVSKHEVILVWEIPGETVAVTDENGEIVDKPRWLSCKYTASLDPKSNLSKVLCAWLKISDPDSLRTYDLTELIGKACQLQVTQTASKDGSRMYNKVGGAISLRRGEKPPKAETVPFVYDIDDGDSEVYKALPEWMRDLIARSAEWAQSHAGTKSLPDFDEPGDVEIDPDDIPF